MAEKDRRCCDETYSNSDPWQSGNHCNNRRVRKLPGILPISLQDVLHSGQSGLHEIILLEDLTESGMAPGALCRLPVVAA
jgi:hypothetical protein